MSVNIKTESGLEKIAGNYAECVKRDWTILRKQLTQAVAGTLEYTGLTVDVPPRKGILIGVTNSWSHSKALKTIISEYESPTAVHGYLSTGEKQASLIYYNNSDKPITLYFHSAHEKVGNNFYMISYNII